MSYEDLSDDITFDTQTKPPAETTSTEIRGNITAVETALTEFERVSAGLAELNEKFPVDLVYDVTNTQGMLEAVAHRAAYREPRLAVERLRKQAKAPVIALGKNIDARAAWVTAQLLLGEKPIDAIIKKEEARKEAIKQARIDAENGRIIAIQEALEEISLDAMLASGKDSSFIANLIAERAAWEPTAEVFQELLPNAHNAKASVLAKLDIAHKAALHTEAEAAKLAAERAELAALRQAAAEQRAKDEEAQRAANERAEAELAEQRAELKRQSDELAAQRAAMGIAQQAMATPDAPAQAAPVSLVAANNAARAEISAAAPQVSSTATLKLGEINARIAPLSITAAGLAELGFEPVGTDKAAKLYSMRDYPLIIAALRDRLAGLLAEAQQAA